MTQQSQHIPVARILVTEDNRMAAKAAQGLFKDKNCHVDVEGSATATLEHLQDHYDLLVIDLGLPDFSGLILAEKIRNSGAALAAAPIVILTAHGDETHKAQAKKLGLNGFLQKPLTSALCDRLLWRFVRMPVDNNYFLEN